ncbi:MAG: ribonuclease E inhibitor RraB [Solirubrobacteraceae bacterium]|nr:ribonuclease E inhibitor RraB [Solirubrobacteraceae bacterium]
MAKASFYVYFTEEKLAEAASERLQGMGYTVDVSAEKDGRFLAEARKSMREHDIDKAEQQMNAIVIDYTGEYDGYNF